MDFNDYIQNLNDLDNQEARAELETFYTLNSATFRFFKLIDKTIIDLLKQSNISSSALNELKSILPQLNKLRKEIGSLESNIRSDDKIQRTINYIKNEMSLSEVTESYQDFRKQCEDRKTILTQQERLAQEKLQARESAKYRLTFEFENGGYFAISMSTVRIYIDDYFLVDITQGTAYECYLLNGIHKIRFERFEKLKIKTTQFSIELKNNIRIYMKCKIGWWVHLEYYCLNE